MPEIASLLCSIVDFGELARLVYSFGGKTRWISPIMQRLSSHLIGYDLSTTWLFIDNISGQAKIKVSLIGYMAEIHHCRVNQRISVIFTAGEYKEYH